MALSRYHRITRWLHLALAVTVTAQLLLSLVMTPPGGEDPVAALGHGAFELHEGFGLAALAVVVIHWLWSAAQGDLGRLFPWGPSGRRAVGEDLRTLSRGRLLDADPVGGLAGAVHGLGLLAVTAMAFTGLALFALWPEAGEPGPLAREVGDVHSAMATLVWIYWFGHVAMAVLHHLAGHNTLRDMFRLGPAG